MSTYPFPLPAHSSHHSLYHRFLLGAQRGVLEPMPKPYCSGRLAPQLGELAEGLTLPKWQKLYSGSFPWTKGHSPESYGLRNVAPHRPLPAAYHRPLRRYAAFDFVQLADPSLSALALVAGDARILSRFVALNEGFCTEVEKAARIAPGEAAPSAQTGRALFGHFVEPSNRWLMPCLHAHSRVLNFTSLASSPQELHPIDAGELACAGRQARSRWLGSQAHLLRSLGYTVDGMIDPTVGLIVSGVDQRVLATLDAPRLAVLKVLERLLGQETWRGLCDPRAPAAQPLLAAMADHLESRAHDSVSHFRPQKLSLPIEGPWRQSVGLHLQKHCPAEYARLRQEAHRAQGLTPLDEAVGQNPVIAAAPSDTCHRHAPNIDAFDAAEQLPTDADLEPRFQQVEDLPRPSAWLAQAYDEAYAQVSSEIVSQRRPWIDAPRQRILRQWEGTNEDIPLEALRRELRCVDGAIERNGWHLAQETKATPAPVRAPSRLLGEFIAAAPARERVLAGTERARGRSL